MAREWGMNGVGFEPYASASEVFPACRALQDTIRNFEHTKPITKQQYLPFGRVVQQHTSALAYWNTASLSYHI